MPRLLLINGLPGSGKSTLAARYVADRPLALCLDVDVVRGLLGAWQEHPHEAGLLARRLALAMARVALHEGRDVVVPQFLGRPQFIGELEALARRCRWSSSRSSSSRSPTWRWRAWPSARPGR